MFRRAKGEVLSSMAVSRGWQETAWQGIQIL
jgi:hypothetical protein